MAANESTRERIEKMSIILDHVNYVYGADTPLAVHALNDVCLKIPDGQFIGIIGHTGSGKSTLMQHMNGLIRATDGHIYFNGEDIYDKDYDMKKLRSKVGLVFQYPEHQLFEIDVFSDVCFGPKNLGLDKKEVELRAYDALKKVGLPDELFYQSPFELSGGQKRRVAIAGVLAYTAVDFLGTIISAELFPGKSVLEVILGQVFVFVVSLIAMVFSTGYSYMMLNMSRGREFSLGNLLYMFHNQPDRVLIVAFVMALLSTVSQISVYLAVYLTEPGSTLQAEMNWMYMIMGVMLLSVVLNVLITALFALSFYLLADNPQMGGVESLKESRRLMKGHVWDYLMLQLSFAPMLIVSLPLMGIPLLWVLPYMDCLLYTSPSPRD